MEQLGAPLSPEVTKTIGAQAAMISASRIRLALIEAYQKEAERLKAELPELDPHPTDRDRR